MSPIAVLPSNAATALGPNEMVSPDCGASVQTPQLKASGLATSFAEENNDNMKIEVASAARTNDNV